MRNSLGEVIGNKSVSLKITILSESIDGSSVYNETHAKKTDASGLISLQIGNGTVISGIFTNIDWGGASHFIKLEADFSGGSNYVVLGTQELMSVPYAMYASKTDRSVLNLTSRLATKLNVTDTVSLSNRINAKLTKTDTAFLSERINTKLNKSFIDLGNQTGDIIYWDENLRKFSILAHGAEGQVLKIVSDKPVCGTDSTTSVPTFSPCETTIFDIDGNSYNSVLFGAQCWTKENLRVRRYNNRTSILFDTTGGSGGISATWQNLTIGAHNIYAHDSSATTPSNHTKYGYLFNWYAAKGISTTGIIVSTDTLNICPKGWHVPTNAEWTTLTTDIGGESVAGGKMKSIGTAYWNSPNTVETNESGFSTLPGGYRFFDGNFSNIKNVAFFWSASDYDLYSAFNLDMSYGSGAFAGSTIRAPKSFGPSVRCLRD